MLKILTGFYSNSQQLVKGSAAFFFMNIAGVALNFVFAMIAGNQYGSTTWGQFTLSITVMQILCIISRMGLDTLIIRLVADEYPQNIGKVKDIYMKSAVITFLAGALATFLLYIFSEVVAVNFFHNPELIPQLKIIAFTIVPMNLLLLNSESMKGIKFPLLSSFFRNACVWIFALPALVLSNLFLDNRFLVDIYTAAVIISWIISTAMVIQQVSFFKIKTETWMNYKSIIQQGFPMMLANSLFYLMVWTDTIILGMFRSEGEVGVYNIAFRISIFLTLSTVAVNGVSAPDIAIFHNKNDKTGLQNVIDKANRLIFWTTFPAILIIMLFANPILKIFGNEFTEGAIALVLLAAGRLAAIFGGRLPILSMVGKQQIDQKIALIVFIINIILNLLLVPALGINGAALSTLITSIIWTAITILYIKKEMQLNALYIPLKKHFLPTQADLK